MQSSGETVSGKLAAKSKLPAGYKSIIKSLSSLRYNEKFSDLTIKCGDFEWRAHKLVVCEQSSYFERACTGEFKEAKDGIIMLDDFHPLAIDAVLDYLYEQDYRDSSLIGSRRLGIAMVKPLLLSVMVYTLADYLDIPVLEALAIEKFGILVGPNWNTFDFSDALRELYGNAPEKDLTMRKRAVHVASEHAETLLGDTDGVFIEFRKVLEEITVFNAEFVLAMRHREKLLDEGHRVWYCASANCFFKLKKDSPRETCCPHCGGTIKSHKTVNLDALLL